MNPHLRHILKYFLLLMVVLFLTTPLTQHIPETEITLRAVAQYGLSCIGAYAILVMGSHLYRLVLEMRHPAEITGTETTDVTTPTGMAVLSTPERLISTARHEASHTVAVLALGHHVINVSTAQHLDLQRQGVSTGHCQWAHADEQIASFDHIVIALAGLIGEQPSSPLSLNGSRDDHQDAWHYTLAYCATATERLQPSDVMDHAMITARNIIAENIETIDELTQLLAANGSAGVSLTGEELEQQLSTPVMPYVQPNESPTR